MKLRLPHKFQAALMAALASVSFTTLSSGTIAVATGAALLAGQQAQAATVTSPTADNLAGWFVHDTENDTWTYSDNYSANEPVTLGSSFSFTDASGEKISFNVGSQSTYTFAFTVDLSKLVVESDQILLTAGTGADASKYDTGIGIDTSRKLTESWNGTVAYSGTKFSALGNSGLVTIVHTAGSTGGYLYAVSADGGTQIQGKNGWSTLKGSYTIKDFIMSDALKDAIVTFGVWQANGTWNNQDTLKQAALALNEVPPPVVWAGTADNHTWAPTGVWANGATFANGGNVKFENTDAYKTVLVASDVTAKKVDVNADYTFVLDGGNLTAAGLAIGGDATGLTIDSGDGTTGTLKVNTAISAAGKTITVNNGAVLQATATGSSFTLAGNGTYALADGVYAKDNGVTIGSNWTGTVLVSNTNVNQNNQVDDVALTNGNQSTLELSGFKGWLANNRWKAEVATNIKLTDYVNGSSTRYAWVSEAYSQNADTMTLTGKWSGTGTYNAAGTNGGTRYMHYNFKGDITDWTGAFLKTSQNTIRTNLTFSENAQNVNIRIDGTGNFGVIVNTAATFSQAVTADTFTVNANMSAKLNGATVVENGITLNTGSSLTVGATGSLQMGGTVTFAHAPVIVEDGGTVSFANTVVFNLDTLDAAEQDGQFVYTLFSGSGAVTMSSLSESNLTITGGTFGKKWDFTTPNQISYTISPEKVWSAIVGDWNYTDTNWNNQSAQFKAGDTAVFTDDALATVQGTVRAGGITVTGSNEAGVNIGAGTDARLSAGTVHVDADNNLVTFIAIEDLQDFDVRGNWTIDADQTLDAGTINGGVLTISKDKTATLTNAENSAALLRDIVGSGNIKLTQDTFFAGSTTAGAPTTTHATGTLIVDGVTLSIGSKNTGSYGSTYVDMSSFKHVQLDDGTLYIHNDLFDLNGLTVNNGKTGTVRIYDTKSEGYNTLNLKGTTQVDGTLTFLGDWKQTFTIDALGGTGEVRFQGIANPEGSKKQIINLGGGTIGKLTLNGDHPNTVQLNVTGDLAVTNALTIDGGKVTLSADDVQISAIDLGNGTLDIAAGTTTVSGNVKLGYGSGKASGTLTVAQGATLTADKVQGAWGYNTFTVNGTINANTLFEISTDNVVRNVTGTGTINTKELLIGNQTGNAIFSGGLTINVGDAGMTGSRSLELRDVTVGVLDDSNGWTASRAINLGSADTGTTFNIGNGKEVTLRGAISGSGKLVKTGEGTLAITSAASYSGATAVNQGTLALGGSITTTGDISVASGAGITFANGSTISANSLTLTSGAKLDFSAYQGAIGSEIHVVTTTGGVTGYEGAVITGPTAPRGMQANVAQEDNDIVLTFQAKEDATMHLYILTGQSNSLGAVKDSPLNASMLAAYQSEGLLFNGNMNKDSGVRFETDPTWQIVAPQKPDGSGYNNNPCMGPEYGFSYIMENKDWGAQLLGEDGTLAVVKGSLDGGGNGYWLQNANAYQSLLGSVKESIQDAVALGYSNISLDGLMYLQGESNSANEASQAATRFTDFIGYLKSDLQSWLTENPELTGITLSFDSNTVTGEPRLGSEARQTTETQLLELATSNDMINADKNGKGHVLTNDLAVTNCDGLNVHYTGNSQLTIGARYAYAFAVQKGIDVGAVRGQDDSKTLDQAGAWWMEKLPGETEVATWDISSVSTVNNIADGATLTVGGIKIDEVYSATATAQGQGSVAINGGAISLGQHGINLVGGDLSITSAVSARATQTWQAAEGHKLAVNATTTISDGATLTLEDGLYLTFGAITGTGSLEIGHVTLDMSEAYMLVNGLGTYRTSTEEVSENGFFTGNLDIVRLTGESSAITFTESGSIASNITQAGDLANYTLSLENGGKTLRVNGLTPDPSVYYARSGEVTYTDTDAAQYGIYTAGQLTLSGTTAAPATLTLASALKEGVTIKAEGLGGTVNIASGVTLAAASVNAASGPVAITGSGKLLGKTSGTVGGVTAVDAFGTGVTLSPNWTGTVNIANTTISSGNIGIKLNELGNENSVVELENVKTFLNTDSYTYTPNIKLTGEGLNIDAGSSDKTYTFNGDVTGSGKLNLSLSRGSNGHTYVFAGDVKGWNGELLAPTNGKTLTVKFSGAADTVNAKITKTGGTLNLVVETDTTFNAAVTGVSSFNIAEGASATLAGTDAHSISNLTVNSGSSFTIATGATATVTGAVLKNTITNDGTVTLAGTVNLDALTATYEREGYLDGQTFGNGFRTIEAYVPVFTQGHVGTVNSADATFTYKNVQGTIDATTGEFQTDYNEDFSTFYVNKNGTTESYSYAYGKAGASMTAVSLANATTINMDKADATLGTLTLAVGDAGAATMKATANATISAMNGLATGQTLHFTGDTATPAVLTLNGDNTGRMAGNVDITGVTVKLGNYRALGAYNGRGAASGTNRTITVGADGVLDMNGAETNGDHGYKITLDGGTLTNTGTARKWSNRQPFTNVVLASDSKAVATNDFGIMASSWNETTLDLQDHVLEVSGAGRFYLSNTTVNAGENGRGTILAKGGTVNFNGNRSDANQQGSFAGNLKMAADDNGTAGTIAGRLKLGGTTKVSSTVEGDTPAVVTADINTNGQTLRFEGAQDINVTPGTATGDNYNGSAAISGNGTIEHASTGTTTISGSMANFNGNVDVEAGVLNIMNAASVNVQNVTLGTGAIMGVYNGESVQIDTDHEGKLTIQTGKVLTAGEGSRLNANLEMAAGSHLDVSADGGVNGLLMGSEVTLNKGMNLEDYSSSVWSTWEDGTKYALFSGVDGLSIGAGMGTEAIDYTQWVDAKEYFTNIEEANRYFLCYDGAPADNQNGVLQASFNGSNVGMVYIMVMPEPTTGTLSLLALCALAARRRRK